MNWFGELGGIEHMLDFHAKRHGMLASNMANAETPGYEAKDMRFVASLEGASSLQTTNDKHMATGGGQNGSPEVIDVTQAPSVDGNGVDKDHTMAQVTANRLRYEQGLELARRRLAIMRYGATDGGG
jgi:flagellar basal-body rod protein FlgB